MEIIEKPVDLSVQDLSTGKKVIFTSSTDVIFEGSAQFLPSELRGELEHRHMKLPSFSQAVSIYNDAFFGGRKQKPYSERIRRLIHTDERIPRGIRTHTSTRTILHREARTLQGVIFSDYEETGFENPEFPTREELDAELEKRRRDGSNGTFSIPLDTEPASDQYLMALCRSQSLLIALNALAKEFFIAPVKAILPNINPGQTLFCYNTLLSHYIPPSARNRRLDISVDFDSQRGKTFGIVYP